MLTHIDDKGNASMVNVANKVPTYRSATARAIVKLPAEILDKLENGEIKAPKGAVFQTAIIAGIMGAKKTGELIPLCHPIGMEDCQINISLNNENELIIKCTASITAKTGIEMEALTGASIAALTIYDMCKAMSHEIEIKSIVLLSKTGGKSDYQRAE